MQNGTISIAGMSNIVHSNHLCVFILNLNSVKLYKTKN